MDQALRITLLGSLRLEVAGRGPLHLPRVLQELIAFVALAGSGRDPVRRNDIAFALWPDRPEAGARRALATALYRLRSAAPGSESWLSANRDSVRLVAAALDTTTFGRLAESPELADRLAALDAYAGDLLPSTDAEWADAPRAVLRARFVALLATVTDEREADGDLPGALSAARRWAATDPLDEDAHRAVMRLFARLGKHAAALDHVEGLATRLADELGVEPAAATLELAERIRSEMTLPRAAPDVGAAVSPAFVGRVAERRHLLDLLDRAGSGAGAFAVVLGEAGIGKSRLLAELDASARWRGVQVSHGRGEEFGSPSPFAPLRAALAEAVRGPRLEQLRESLDPAVLAAASPVIPDLAAGVTGWRHEPNPGDVAPAVEAVLRGLAAISPQLVLLDDVQWADDAVWPVLDHLRSVVAGQRLLLVVSGRTEELAARPAGRRSLERWDGAGVPLLHLAGLDTAELASLSTSLEGRPRSHAEIEALAAASGGNPLLALALLATGGLPGIETGREHVPRADLDRLFEHRLASLSPDARAALEAAAVVGQRVAYPVWQAVAGDPDLARRAGELERAGLLRLEDDGYTFAHDTLRRLVVWNLPADRRRALHLAALDARLQRAPGDAMALLHDAEQVGDGAAIATWAARAGAQALAAHSFEAARRHFDRCLAVLPQGARAERLAALLGRVRATDVLADRDAQRADLNELEALAEALGDVPAMIEVARQAAAFHWAIGELAAGEAAGRRGIDLAVGSGDPGGEAALLAVTARILREQGRLPEAGALATRARTLFEGLGDVHGTARAVELLAGIGWRLGQHRPAADQHREAADLFERTGDVRRAAMSLNSLGTALWGLGDYDGSRAVHEASLATARAFGDRRLESDNLDNLGGVAWVLADYERAIELYRAALAIRRDARDPRGIAISLINLGDTYTLTGDLEAAVAAFDEALEVDRAVGIRRNEATARQGKGKALLEAGRATEARASLEAATTIHEELGDRDNLADVRAALALACLEAGDPEAGQAVISDALASIGSADRPALREWVRFAAWRVTTEAGDGDAAATHLAHAVAAMDELVGSLPDEAQGRVLDRVPLHRRVRATRTAGRRQVRVALPRADVPLGRPVAAAEYVTVEWTIHDPADLLTEDGPERRRRICTRLIAEATAQGATATDEDLARALGVSRRTILRDARALAGSGDVLATRRRSRPPPEGIPGD